MPPKHVRGGAVSSDGVVIRTYSKNRKTMASLLGDLQDVVLGDYYTVVAKGMDVVLGCDYYNKLLTQNIVQIGKQHPITLINIADSSFFAIKKQLNTRYSRFDSNNNE